jgi:hypothetical protein
MTTISAEVLAAIAQAVAQALATQQTSPKVTNGTGTAKPATPVDRLASKDAALLRAFAKRGYKDVVLMNRLDKSAPYNVRPFKGWLEQGRLVRKGEHGVRGLFHVSQTDPVVKAPANPKPAAKSPPIAPKAMPKVKARALGEGLVSPRPHRVAAHLAAALFCVWLLPMGFPDRARTPEKPRNAGFPGRYPLSARQKAAGISRSPGFFPALACAPSDRACRSGIGPDLQPASELGE